MAEFAHANDMTQGQLDATFGHFGGVITAQQEQERSQLLEQGQAHVAAWGDLKTTNLSLVKRALTFHDPEGAMSALLDSSGQGNNPVILDFFLSLGNNLQEGGFLKNEPQSPNAQGSTAASAMFGKNHPSKAK
jgi:hypothetical protein